MRAHYLRRIQAFFASSLVGRHMFSIRVREVQGICILDLKGKLGFTADLYGRSTHEVFRERLEGVTSLGKKQIILNLSQLLHIDAIGIRTLIDAAALLRNCGGRLTLVTPGGPSREVLALTRLDEALGAFPTEQDAVASFGKAK